jgi:hypothetical protein
MSNLQLRPTEETDLDYVLEAENDSENRQYIIPWSRERHFQSVSALLLKLQHKSTRITRYIIIHHIIGFKIAID